MKAFWSDTRPNGQPVEPGTVCFITDLEDGSHPIPTYGKDREEVLQKLALQNAHAQLAIARRSAANPAPNPPTPPAPAPPRRVIAPDQIMRATTDLQDPARSGQAVATLLEAATGINPQNLIAHNYGLMAKEWEDGNPEFFAHIGNRKLMTAEAVRLAGSLGNVTREHLDHAFSNLRSRGELFEAPAPNPNPSPSPTFPDESQVQRQDQRPRPRFGTGARSTTFRATPPARTLKYTEEEIRTMPASKARRLIETNDKDYAECCEAYYGSSAQAS